MSRRALVAQLGRFGLVGIFNTALDFAVFGALRVAGVPIVLSNVISTSTGMAFSFFLNRWFVFGDQESARRRLVPFLLGTAFGMYVLQNVVIVFLSDVFPAPIDALAARAAEWGLTSSNQVTLVRSNLAKLAATAVSLTWNFCFYRFFVFARPGDDRGAET